MAGFQLFTIGRFWVFTEATQTFVNGCLEVVEALTLPDYGLEIRLAQLMEGLPDFY